MSFKSSQHEFHSYLTECSNAYYNTGEPLISDAEFDVLVEEFESKFKVQYQYLGKPNHSKIKLPIYMGSLDKHKSDNELRIFCQRFPTTPQILITTKLDGMSLLYCASKKSLYTRGDGQVGSNVSHLLPYLNLPTHSNHYLIRGEIVLPKTIPKARNIISGLVNSKTVDEELIKQAHFIAYSVYDQKTQQHPFSTYQEELKWLKDSGKFEVPPHFLNTEITQSELTSLFNKCRDQSPFDIDGLVLQVNTDLMFIAGQNPRNACAFKVQTPTKQTKVLGIEWNESAFQSWHPIVNIEPVEWDGVIIRNCSGFHAQYIQQHSLGPNAIVSITRAGDVIPDIVSVIKSAPQPQMPTGFSSEDPNWFMKGVHLYCKVKSQAGKISQLLRFFTTVDVPGLKESTIKSILDGNTHIQNEGDFMFRLKLDDVKKLEGFGDKKADKIMQALDICRKNLTLTHCIKGSAMFQGFSEKKIDKLITHLESWCFDYILKQKTIPIQHVEELCNANSILKQANEFATQLQPFCDRYQELIQFLYTKKQASAAEVSVAGTNKRGSPSKHEQKGILVFTGFRDKKWKQELENEGWVVADTITKATNFIIALDANESSTKLEKARTMRIPIMNKEQFLQQQNKA